MEGLGDEWDRDVQCEIPKESAKMEKEKKTVTVAIYNRQTKNNPNKQPKPNPKIFLTQNSLFKK